MIKLGFAKINPDSIFVKLWKVTNKIEIDVEVNVLVKELNGNAQDSTQLEKSTS